MREVVKNYVFVVGDILVFALNNLVCFCKKSLFFASDYKLFIECSKCSNGVPTKTGVLEQNKLLKTNRKIAMFQNNQDEIYSSIRKPYIGEIFIEIGNLLEHLEHFFGNVEPVRARPVPTGFGTLGTCCRNTTQTRSFLRVCVVYAKRAIYYAFSIFNRRRIYFFGN